MGKRPAALLPSQKRRRPLARAGVLVCRVLFPAPGRRGAGNKTRWVGLLAPVGRRLVKDGGWLGMRGVCSLSCCAPTERRG